VRTAGLALIFAVLLTSLPAAAQQRADMPAVGWFVFSRGKGPRRLSSRSARAWLCRGKNIAIEVRTPEESDERLVEQIQDLARLNIKVLITGGVPVTLAAKRATLQIPVVFGMADPVGSEVVASLAHPGGNMVRQFLAIEEQFAGKCASTRGRRQTKEGGARDRSGDGRCEVAKEGVDARVKRFCEAHHSGCY